MIERFQAVGDCIDGNTSSLEMSILMVSALSLPIGAKVFEFGTFEGKSSLNISRCLRSGIVYTLDLPENVTPDNATGANEKYFHHKIKYRSPNVTYLKGDSMKFDFSPYFGRMDMVFVDGNHNHPFPESDIANGMKMISKNGILWAHDYNPGWPDVMKAIETMKSEWRFVDGTSLAFYRR